MRRNSRRTNFVCLSIGLALTPTFAWASSTPFSALVNKFQTVIEDLKVFVAAAIAALVLWTIVDLARGNGMAWGKLGLSIFGLFVVSEYDSIIEWFGGYAP